MLSEVQGGVEIDVQRRGVHLRDLFVGDEDVFRILSEADPESLPERVRRALKVGVIALRDSETISRVDFVERSFMKMRQEMETFLEGLLGSSGPVPALIQRHFGEKGEMERKLAEVFGKDGELLRKFEEQYGREGKLRAILNEYLGEKGEMHQKILEVFGEEGRLDRRLKEFLGEGGSLEQVLSEYLGEGGRLQQTVQSYLGSEGVLGRSLDAVFGDGGTLKVELERHFGDKGSVIYRTLNPSDEESVLGRFRRQMEALVDPSREGSPFGDLKRSLLSEFKELHGKLGARRAVEEERERSSLKGIPFEEFVYQAVSSLAAPLDDRVEHVGAQPGPLGDVGDIKVTVNPGHAGGREVRVVFEVKNRSISLRGKNSIFEELEAARKNRDALYAVVVVRAKEAPPEVGSFRVDPKGAIICAVEEEGDLLPLEVAYKVARAEAIRASGEGEGQVDTREILASLEKVRSKLEMIKGMKAGLTGAEKSLRQVKEDLDVLRDGVREVLDRVSPSVPTIRPASPAA